MRMMSKTKIEALRGTWVRIQLSSGREYVGYFRKLRTDPFWLVCLAELL